MRSFHFLRTALTAASLIASVGHIGTAFADDMQSRSAQQKVVPSYSNVSPYDAPNFVLDESNIHG